MEQPLYTFLERKFTLHAKKHRILARISERKSYFGLFRDLHLLRAVITQEIALNNKILKRINRVNWKLSKIGIEPLFSAVEYSTRAVLKILKEEANALKDVTILDLAMHHACFLVKKDSRFYLARSFESCMQKYDEEEKQNSNYLALVEKEGKQLSILVDYFAKKKDSFFMEKELFRKAQDDYRQLVRAVGNRPEVEKRAKDLLKLTDRIRGTKVYEFIKDDVSAFEKKVRYIMGHPKDHRATYVLASAYIISPGTFEATFVILLFRYLSKYVIYKTKKNKF